MHVKFEGKGAVYDRTPGPCRGAPCVIIRPFSFLRAVLCVGITTAMQPQPRDKAVGFAAVSLPAFWARLAPFGREAAKHFAWRAKAAALSARGVIAEFATPFGQCIGQGPEVGRRSSAGAKTGGWGDSRPPASPVGHALCRDGESWHQNGGCCWSATIVDDKISARTSYCDCRRNAWSHTRSPRQGNRPTCGEAAVGRKRPPL